MRIRVNNPTYGMILSIPGLILLLLWVLIPFVYVFNLSFLRYDNIHPVTPCGFENYKELFRDPIFRQALKRTLIFGFGSTSLTLIISLTLALSLNRIERFMGFFRSLVIMPWAVPMILSGFIWAWIFNPAFGVIPYTLTRLGLTKEPLDIFSNPSLAMLGVIIADSWRRIPFMTVLTLAGLQAIPKDLYDAAKVDGADCIDTFWHITLPMVKRPMLIGVLITLMFSLRSVDVIYSMTPGGGPGKVTYVLGTYIFDYIYKFLDFGLAAAGSVVLIILTFIVGFVFIYYTMKRE